MVEILPDLWKMKTLKGGRIVTLKGVSVKLIGVELQNNRIAIETNLISF